MRVILVPVGPPPARQKSSPEAAAGLCCSLLVQLRQSLAGVFGHPIGLRPRSLDTSFALDLTRNQFFSTAILQRLESLAEKSDCRLLGVTTVDLFVPVLTFVFGEAQLGGTAALVSTHRLRPEFYGLPPDPGLLRERLVKEAVHELGHTLGLRHCGAWHCAMASTHAIETLDVKNTEFCPACRRQLPETAGARHV